jgi:hypothetical protein
MTPFERGLIAHRVADWILPNDWMACHKTNLRHPAAFDGQVLNVENGRLTALPSPPGHLEQAHPWNAAFHASFQRSTSNRAFQSGVGTRCRAFPEIPL